MDSELAGDLLFLKDACLANSIVEEFEEVNKRNEKVNTIINLLE